MIAALCVLAVSASKVSRIIGGEELTDASRFPFVASIGVQSTEFNHWCGGVLVSPFHVLTAAHCVSNTVGNVAVAVGSLQPTSGSAPAFVARMHIHPEFNPTSLDMDLALLELGSAFPRTRLPRLPSNSDPAPKHALVLGWGATVEGGPLSKTLHIANVSIGSCGSYSSDSITQNMVCAREDGVDTCQGDSGGPLLVCHDEAVCTVVGITSWGYSCAHPEYPGVYARVLPARRWIQDTMAAGDAFPPSPPPLPPALDCIGMDASEYMHYLGDGVCDGGLFGVDFNCAAFECDKRDCGDACTTLRDCDGAMADPAWLGDGTCDDGRRGARFDCGMFECDRGDCDCEIAVPARVLRSAYREQCCGGGADCLVKIARREIDFI